MNLPLPIDIPFDLWAATVLDLLDLAGDVPQPEGEERWRWWTERLAEDDSLEEVPYHEAFETWQAWAARFVELTEGA